MADLLPVAFAVESERLRKIVEKFVASLESLQIPEKAFDSRVVTALTDNKADQSGELIPAAPMLVNVNRSRSHPTESENMRTVQFNKTVSSQLANSQQPKGTATASTQKRSITSSGVKTSSVY